MLKIYVLFIELFPTRILCYCRRLVANALWNAIEDVLVFREGLAPCYGVADEGAVPDEVRTAFAFPIELPKTFVEYMLAHRVLVCNVIDRLLIGTTFIIFEST